MAEGNGNGDERIIRRAVDSAWLVVTARVLTIIVSIVVVPVGSFLAYQAWRFFERISDATTETKQAIQSIELEQKTATDAIEGVRREQNALAKRVYRVESVFFSNATPPPPAPPAGRPGDNGG